MDSHWNTLAPHRPLEPGASAYVPPPSGGARDIVSWVEAGGSTLLIGGPAGIGKSTEIAQAARLLQSSRVAFLISIDRLENMRRLTPERMLLRIAQRVTDIAGRVLRLPLSTELRQAVERADVDSQPHRSESLVRSALAEIGRLAVQRRVTLLIDGLEKVPQGPAAADLFDALGRLPEQMDLVVVIPWHAAFGPRADFVVRAGERYLPLRAIETDDPSGEPGRRFLADMLAAHLGRAPDPAATLLVDQAARWSGGIPRIFLQLLADAATYAQLRRGRELPDLNDLSDAVADQQDSFRRLLLPGDTQAILSVERTDGRELDLSRKIRLLAHGVLIERMQNNRPLLAIHPLAADVIREGAGRA